MGIRTAEVRRLDVSRSAKAARWEPDPRSSALLGFVGPSESEPERSHCHSSHPLDLSHSGVIGSSPRRGWWLQALFWTSDQAPVAGVRVKSLGNHAGAKALIPPRCSNWQWECSCRWRCSLSGSKLHLFLPSEPPIPTVVFRMWVFSPQSC